MRLLFVSASPPRRPLPWCSEELARLNKLKLSGVEQLINATPQKLTEALESSWDIVHISAHGDPDGLLLYGTDRHGRRVPGVWLADAFRSQVGGLILNACCSDILAASVLSHAAAWRIGAEGKLSDEATPDFTESLYRSLCLNGMPIKTAFLTARISAQARGTAEYRFSGDNEWKAPAAQPPLPITPTLPAVPVEAPEGWEDMGVRGISREGLEVELVNLLLTMSTSQGIRALVRFLPGGFDLQGELLEPGVTRRRLAETTVSMLSQERRIDQALFTAMKRRYKAYRSEIDRLEQRWGQLA